MPTYSPNFRIGFYKGDTHTAQYEVYDSHGVILDITTGTPRLYVYDSTGALVLTVTGTIPVGTDGKAVYKFVPGDTAAMTVGVEYDYRAKVTIGTDVYTIAKDKLVLI
jgi:hypothetical protein